MRVGRIGLTPVKGGRHRSHPSVELSATGPVGDRAFCLVDLATDRCLRTVENPTLLQAAAAWDGEVLSVDLPDGAVAGVPVRTGETRTVDYWGRRVHLALVAGPWAAAYSAHLRRDVVLAACAPGDVVYGGAVTLVTGASLARLAEEVGRPVEGARFRATFEVDVDGAPPGVEEAWVGRRLRLGEAELTVRRLVPRCAVIDLDPATGARDLDLLRVLARRGRAGGDVVFGVDADVTVPGRVAAGDACSLVPA